MIRYILKGNKKINLLLSMLILILPVKVFSQDYFKTKNSLVSFPEAKAWSFMNYGNFPVSHYTGTVDIGFDLFNEKISDFDLRLGISYNFLENKPSTLPSQLGLGFSLDIGGCVTRVVKGFPDEIDGFYYHGGNMAYFRSNRLEYLSQVINRSIDNEPDLFYYKFGSYSGSFYFDANRNIISDNYNNLKIQVNVAYSAIASVIFVDPQGIRYEFNIGEESSVYKTTNSSIKYNSAWWLSKITLPNSEIITFEYYPTSYNLLDGSYMKSYERAEEEGVILFQIPENIYNLETNYRSNYETYIKKVNFPNGSINFFLADRVDKGGEKAKKIDKITILNRNDELIKRYDFTYFENQTERFKLKAITESLGGQTALFRAFEYNNTRLPYNTLTGAPPYYSEAVDYWGYYNGENGNIGQSEIPLIKYNDRYYGKAIRVSNLTMAKAEILEKIVYPTGGFTSFDYELNDFSKQGESYSPVGSGQLIRMDADFYYEEGLFSMDPYGIEFTLKEKTRVELVKWARTEPGGTNYNWITKTPTSSTEQQFVELGAGTYNLGQIFKTNDLLNSSNTDVLAATGRATYYVKDENPAVINNTYGGGLRIGKITNSNGKTTNTKRYKYVVGLGSDESSGILTMMPSYFIDGTAINVNGYFSSSKPIMSYNESEIIGYSKVFELYDDGSYIEYNYSSLNEYPDEIVDGSGDFFFKANLWPRVSNKKLRGKLTSKYLYSSTGKVLRSEAYTYSELADERTKSLSYIIVNPLFPVTRFTTGGSYSDIESFTFSTLFNRRFPFIALTQKTVTDHSGIVPVENIEDYKYDNIQHSFPTSTKKTDSRGAISTSYTSYPMDYGGGFANLLEKNIVGLPIENILAKDFGNTTKIISGNLNIFDNTGMLIENYALESKLNLTDFKFSNQVKGSLPNLKNKSVFAADSHYYKLFKVSNKTTYNRPLEVWQLDLNNTYLWGYGSQYPIIEIKNAKYGEVLSVLTQATIDNLNSSSQTEATMETLIKSAADKLRTNLPQAMVTSYTYKPLVGMTSKTDARGITEYYKYDGMQRLQAILDHLNNVNRSFDYHYRSN